MKLFKQFLAGLAILALAIVIVDCRKNLQEVLEEQATKTGDVLANVSAPASVAISESPIVNKSEAQPAESATLEPVSETVELAPELDLEALEKEAIKGKKVKAKKSKVITIMIHETPDALSATGMEINIDGETATVKKAEKRIIKDCVELAGETTGQTPEVKTDKADGEKEVKPVSGEEPQVKSEAFEKKAAVKLESKSKTSYKKQSGDSKKREKRETKKSGSGKNAKTKRSAEKSRKYESKKKSKK